MKISVLGAGRWGSFIAWYLSLMDETVLWGRETSRNVKALMESRTNGVVTLGDRTIVTTDLDLALSYDVIVISISCQELRAFAKEISERVKGDSQKKFILCMKGLEENSGKRLSEVFDEAYSHPHDTAVWIGPGHVESFVNAIPNCMLIDSENEELKRSLANSLSSSLIRFYFGNDLVGNEVGAASKNVIGLAAGMLDGLGLSSLKGALMARGAGEISRLIEKMGGDKLSAYGLSHLGDYEATLFSPHSHNRAYGESIVRGEPFDKLAEGVATCKALKVLSEKYQVDLPICAAVYKVLFENSDPQETLNTLFSRNIKSEFN